MRFMAVVLVFTCSLGLSWPQEKPDALSEGALYETVCASSGEYIAGVIELKEAEGCDGGMPCRLVANMIEVFAYKSTKHTSAPKSIRMLASRGVLNTEWKERQCLLLGVPVPGIEGVTYGGKVLNCEFRPEDRSDFERLIRDGCEDQ